MARVGLDVDDVLYPWTWLAHEECSAAGITKGRRITQWAFHEDYGVSSKVVWDVLHRAYENGMLLNGEPIGDAEHQIQRLRKAGHTVHLITARGFEGPMAPLVREHTVKWLSKVALPHDTLTFSKDKRLINVDWFLDDGIHNYDDMRPYTEAFLLNVVHNQVEGDGRRRVDSLKEFVDIVLSMDLEGLHS